MEKVYSISNIKFDNKYIMLCIDNQPIKLELEKVSEKLAKASEIEKNDFNVSPSGYGIHWRLLDEDLSINGILKLL